MSTIHHQIGLHIFLQHLFSQLQPSHIALFYLSSANAPAHCPALLDNIRRTTFEAADLRNSPILLFNASLLQSSQDSCQQSRAISSSRMLCVHVFCSNDSVSEAEEVLWIEKRLAGDYLRHDHIFLLSGGFIWEYVLSQLHRNHPGSMIAVLGTPQELNADDFLPPVLKLRTAGWNSSTWWRPNRPNHLPRIRRTDLCRVTHCSLPAEDTFIIFFQSNRADKLLLDILTKRLLSSAHANWPAIPYLQLETTIDWPIYPRLPTQVQLKATNWSADWHWVRQIGWGSRTYVLYVPNWWHWRPKGQLRLDRNTEAAIAIAVSWLVWLLLVAVRWLRCRNRGPFAELLLDMWARANSVSIAEPSSSPVSAVSLVASFWGLWNSMAMTSALFGIAVGDDWAPVFDSLADLRRSGGFLRVHWMMDEVGDLQHKLKTVYGVQMLKILGRYRAAQVDVSLGYIVPDGFDEIFEQPHRKWSVNGSYMMRPLRDPELISTVSMHCEPYWMNSLLRPYVDWLHATGIVQHLLHQKMHLERARLEANFEANTKYDGKGDANGIQMPIIMWIHILLLGAATGIFLTEIVVERMSF